VPKSSDGSDLPPPRTSDAKQSTTSLINPYYKKAGVSPVPDVKDATSVHCAPRSQLGQRRNSTRVKKALPTWHSLPHCDKSAPDSTDDNEDEEGKDLCSCTFSLAKILLNTATLRLKRRRRYGLCGRNSSGKVPSSSTLSACF